MMDAGLGEVRAAFDRVAPSYDSVMVRNPINAWMHQATMHEVRNAFPPGTALLELGCGTGTAALELAGRGCRVFGLDIAGGMVAKATEKAQRSKLAERAMFVQARSADLVHATNGSPWRPFDGGYANFTLTYEPSLRTIAEALAQVLKPEATFVCTLPNRIVLSELLLYAPLLRFPKLLWRLEQPLMKDVHGIMVESRAYSVWQVREAFRAHFRLERVMGVPTFLPPVYLHNQYRRLGGAQRVLQGLDRRLARRFPWNRLGEHTLYRFRKKPA